MPHHWVTGSPMMQHHIPEEQSPKTIRYFISQFLYMSFRAFYNNNYVFPTNAHYLLQGGSNMTGAVCKQVTVCPDHI
jgi:hypothetical protein